MMKLAIGTLALVVLVGGLISPAAAQDPWGWMYLSTDPLSYNCDDGGTRWTTGQKTIYLVLESPNWGPADNYGGIEFSVDFNDALFHISTTSPASPNAQFFGDCLQPGHCTYGMGAGGPVSANPWTAANLNFITFADVDNLGFSLGPWDNESSDAQGGPAWAYFDTLDPPIYIPQVGDGTPGHPAWQQGFVVLNYTQGTALADPFPATVYRDASGVAEWPLWSDGDPCARNKVTANDESSWGALKAGY